LACPARPLFLKVHVQGTETVLRACEAAGVPVRVCSRPACPGRGPSGSPGRLRFADAAPAGQRFVLTSSASVLYDGTDLLDATEDHPYAAKPADPYTETKIYQEQVRGRRQRHPHAPRAPTQTSISRALRACGHAPQIVLKANTAKLQTIALRPHTIFGPKDQCITTMVEQGRKGSLKFIVGDGQNIVDVTYVANLVHAHLLAAESLTPGSATAGKAYHITNDEPVKFWEFTGNVLEVYGLPRPSIPIPAKLLLALTIVVAFVLSLLEPLTGPIKNTFTPSRIRLASTHHSYSCARAKAELGYRPLYNNMQSIVATYQQATARK